ncbi:hydrogenase expression/formation protein HypE [Seleniivibrio sp.]|uniref:hydrogenase expression/formation protein HypE n=1 Tax=Seleniivibrio sp. TaxID=2898801 RepID=UPI0025E60392|nr:hydrogenase expression/formation protein HypE [Seleniivibrio sp.]MCD8553689.1 hydrogenase expression/formation protein HypE [Seleniivibrio sp.]
MDRVTLAVGGGGASTQSFISDVIFSKLGNPLLKKAADAALVETTGRTAFTTDSFVVRPEFFPGSDIGKIAVCGTVNDLLVSGAIPEYLSFGLVIPEGYLLKDLEKVIDSMAATCEKAGVKIVCGDTKVVERGALDGLIINTSGIGRSVKDYTDYANIKDGDRVILTSDAARHGMSVLLARGELGFDGEIDSDCAPLNDVFEAVRPFDVSFARDATRGGIAAVLNEIAAMCGAGFVMDDDNINVRENVRYLCDMLGFDPLSVANEGLAVIIIREKDAEKALEALKKTENGAGAAIAGTVTADGKVVLKTSIGGRRFIEMPRGELLPRIC